MSAGTPYIGSKINLISKAEIRYQGTLYQVDTKEATVTLAKVRSFGTESRPVSKPIPPRNETYEFIIFRGSDIKDLNVIDVPSQPPEPEDSPPQDPAILSATHVPHVTMGPPSSQQAPQHPPPAGYPPFPQPNMYSPFGMPYVRPPVMMGARPGPHPPMHPSPVNMQRDQPQQSILGAPGVSIPAQPPINNHLAQSSENTLSIIGAPPEPTAAPTSESQPQASSTPMVQGTASEEPVPKASLPLERESPGARANPSVPANSQQVQPPISEQRSSVSLENQPQVDSTTQPEVEAGSKTREQQYRRNYRPRPQQEFRANNRGQHRRGGYHRGNYRGGRSGGARTRPPRGGSHGSNGPVFRYESEFDFESANARFKKEAFEEEFKALNIEDKTESHSRRESESNAEVDSIDDRGAEVEVVEEAEESEDDFYDKSKSFFDSIGHESGPNRRPDRNAEREMNTETFGVSNYRVYRPRGRGRGRGYRGRWYRGGDGGYRNRQDRTGSYGNRDGDNRQRDANYGNRQDRTGSYGNRDGDTRQRDANYGNRQDRTGSYGNRDGDTRQRDANYGNRQGRPSYSEKKTNTTKQN